MSYLSLVRLVPKIMNVANAELDGRKAVRWVIGQQVRQETMEDVRLGKEEIRQLLDGAFVTYASYAAWNVVLLATACFVNRLFDPHSLTLLAAGYAMLMVKMLLSGRIVAMLAYDRWQKGQLVLSFNGSLYRFLDAEVGGRVADDVRQRRPMLQWIYARLGIPATAQSIIVDGLFDTLRRNVCRFLLCFVIAWTFYLAITRCLVVPLVDGLGDGNWLFATLYPFHASLGILAEDLSANPAWSVLFAVLFCVLFARTTWCIHRRYGVLAGVLAWLLFLVVTTAVLYGARFTCTGAVLFVQSILTFEKCVTGHYVYPGLSD